MSTRPPRRFCRWRYLIGPGPNQLLQQTRSHTTPRCMGPVGCASCPCSAVSLPLPGTLTTPWYPGPCKMLECGDPGAWYVPVYPYTSALPGTGALYGGSALGPRRRKMKNEVVVLHLSKVPDLLGGERGGGVLERGEEEGSSSSTPLQGCRMCSSAHLNQPQGWIGVISLSLSLSAVSRSFGVR